MFVTELNKVAAELGATVAADGGGPTKHIKPCRENFDDSFGGQGMEELVQGIAAPVIDADEVVLAVPCCIGKPKWDEGADVLIGLEG